MSNYTIDILKAMISAGLDKRPEDCPEDLWNEASIVDATYSEVTNVPSVSTTPVELQPMYPTSYGFETFGSSSGMTNVDVTLRNKSGQLMIGDKEILKIAFPVTLKLGESAFKRSIKISQGGDTKYFSTYGGGRSTDGEDWKMVVARCKVIDPNSYEYDSADLVFELEQDLKAQDGSVAAAKGTRVGYTTAATNRKALIDLKQQMMKVGASLDGDVKVSVKPVVQKNQKGNMWTILEFELV